MSKKTILVAVFSAGILFSCQKQEIVPGQYTTTEREVVPVKAVSSGFGNDDTDAQETVLDKIDSKKENDNITDPNNDEDRNKKKKGIH